MAGVGFGPAWTGAYRIIVAETSRQQRTGLVADDAACCVQWF